MQRNILESPITQRYQVREVQARIARLKQKRETQVTNTFSDRLRDANFLQLVHTKGGGYQYRNEHRNNVGGEAWRVRN